MGSRRDHCHMGGRTLVTCNVVVGVRNVSGIRINEDLNSAVHGADEEVSSVINFTDGRTTSAS